MTNIGRIRVNLIVPWTDPEGGGGVFGPLLNNHKNIWFLSNTGLDPLKNHKVTNQHSMLGHHWHARETPFKFSGSAHVYSEVVVFHSGCISVNVIHSSWLIVLLQFSAVVKEFLIKIVHFISIPVNLYYCCV